MDSAPFHQMKLDLTDTKDKVSNQQYPVSHIFNGTNL